MCADSTLGVARTARALRALGLAVRLPLLAICVLAIGCESILGLEKTGLPAAGGGSSNAGTSATDPNAGSASGSAQISDGAGGRDHLGDAEGGSTSAISDSNAGAGSPPASGDAGAGAHTTSGDAGAGSPPASGDAGAAGAASCSPGFCGCRSELACADPKLAAWPVPNSAIPGAALPNPQHYDTARLAGVVIDQVTGLMWQRELDARTFLWHDAQAYCGSINLGGYSDWRLPSRIELVSIVDWSRRAPAIDSAVFSDAPSSYFWSASLDFDPYAYYVDFASGSAAISGSSNPEHRYRARCVRSACPVCKDADAGTPPSNRYGTDTIQGVEVVTDPQTGLAWQTAVADAPLTWIDAQAYCAALGTGFRLPSVPELLSILQDDDDSFVPVFRTSTSVFWTSTPAAGTPGYAWTSSVFDISYGQAQMNDENDEHSVRCVQ